MGEHRVFDSTNAWIYTFSDSGELVAMNDSDTTEPLGYNVDEAQRIIHYGESQGLSDDIDTLTGVRLVLSQRLADGYLMKFTKLDTDE